LVQRFTTEAGLKPASENERKLQASLAASRSAYCDGV
jgi:hypothetical protein